MEVAPFFFDFPHFLSIFTIFIDFHDSRTFVAIYIVSQFTHFFRNFILAKIASSATSHVFCMYDDDGDNFGENMPEPMVMMMTKMRRVLDFGEGQVLSTEAVSCHFNLRSLHSSLEMI